MYEHGFLRTTMFLVIGLFVTGASTSACDERRLEAKPLSEATNDTDKSSVGQTAAIKFSPVLGDAHNVPSEDLTAERIGFAERRLSAHDGRQ